MLELATLQYLKINATSKTFRHYYVPACTKANHNIKVLPEYIYKLMLLRIFPEIILNESQGHEIELSMQLTDYRQ